jgi:hypothetical protein
MADLTAIRTALAAQIQANAKPYLRAEGDPKDQGNPPVALILPGRPFARYGATIGGAFMSGGAPVQATDFNLNVMILVSKGTTLDRAQENLDQWLGFQNDAAAVSVAYAIAMDPTLGGVVADCEANEVTAYGPIQYAGAEYLGATITCSVMAQ